MRSDCEAEVRLYVALTLNFILNVLECYWKVENSRMILVNLHFKGIILAATEVKIGRNSWLFSRITR